MSKHNKSGLGGIAVASRPAAVTHRLPVIIPCPKEQEVLSHPTYTFQIAVCEPAAGVMLSIDQGEWQPCREALGLWWFDWSGYAPGQHRAVARMRMPDGTTNMSAARYFEVKLGL